jgi:hypothetical protein
MTDQAIHRWKLNVVTDGREVHMAQIPSVAFHPAVIAARGTHGLAPAVVKHLPAGRSLAVWAAGDAAFDRDGRPPPWSKAIRSSPATCRRPIPNVEVRSGDALQTAALSRRWPVWPVRIERLLAGNELSMHKDAAAELRIKRWALDIAFSPTPLRTRRSPRGGVP